MPRYLPESCEVFWITVLSLPGSREWNVDVETLALASTVAASVSGAREVGSVVVAVNVYNQNVRVVVESLLESVTML